MLNSSDFWGPPRPYRGYMFLSREDIIGLARGNSVYHVMMILQDAISWPLIFGELGSKRPITMYGVNVIPSTQEVN